MPRVAKNVASRRRRKRVLKLAKGYFGGRRRLLKTAQEAVNRAQAYAFQGRKRKKRDYRQLWVIRIRAGALQHGLKYSQLIHGLKLANIDIDRKVLSEMAITDPKSFAELAGKAKASLEAQ